MIYFVHTRVWENFALSKPIVDKVFCLCQICCVCSVSDIFQPWYKVVLMLETFDFCWSLFILPHGYINCWHDHFKTLDNCIFSVVCLFSFSGNYFLLFIYTFCFLLSIFPFSFFPPSPLREQTQRRLWTKNRAPLTLLLLVILFFTIMLLFSVFNF